jgi:hypothetical protein
VQQSPVEIHCDQLYGHVSIVACEPRCRARGGRNSGRLRVQIGRIFGIKMRSADNGFVCHFEGGAFLCFL